MASFVDRVEDLQFLEDEYRREGSSLVVIYGRRRVGKTTLIGKFIKGKNALYYLATQENETQNRNAFKEAMTAFSSNTLLEAANFERWEPLFVLLLEEVAKNQREGKLVIVLDEFQYLGKSNSAFPSIIQKIWDTLLKDKNVMLILCGSLISLMERQTLSYSSPLYGRRTGQIKLKPIPFASYGEFYPNAHLKDLIELYAVTGGVPKYIELFDGTGDIYHAIENHILASNSFLYAEPTFILQNEVTEIGTYFSILKSISNGNRKLAHIAADLEIKPTSLSKYLNTLIELEILEREVPVTEEKPEKSKRGLYRVKDNFFRFWFRFVFPQRGLLEIGQAKAASRIIKRDFSAAQVSYVYEDVCTQGIWRYDTQKEWGFAFDRCGRWWDNAFEIDIIAYDSTGDSMVFCECKYANKPIGLDVLKNLKDKAAHVVWNNDCRKEYFILFSINGFSQELLEYAASHQNVRLASSPQT